MCFFYSSRLLANISAVSPNRSRSFVLSVTSGKVLRLPDSPVESFSSFPPLFSSLGGFDGEGTTWSPVGEALKCYYGGGIATKGGGGGGVPLVFLVGLGWAAVLLSTMMLFGTRGECLLLCSEGDGGDASSLLLFRPDKTKLSMHSWTCACNIYRPGGGAVEGSRRQGLEPVENRRKESTERRSSGRRRRGEER